MGLSVIYLPKFYLHYWMGALALQYSTLALPATHRFSPWEASKPRGARPTPDGKRSSGVGRTEAEADL